MDGFETNLLANIFQLATLALGVCLLAVWINYAKTSHDRVAPEQDADLSGANSGPEYARILKR